MENDLVLDANILMEILFQREKYDSCTELLLKSNIFITPITANIVMYFSELEKLNLKNSIAFLQKFEILKMDQISFDLAIEIYDGKDFEDSLQIAIAKQNNIHHFATLDKKLYSRFKNDLEIILV